MPGKLKLDPKTLLYGILLKLFDSIINKRLKNGINHIEYLNYPRLKMRV